MYFSTAILASGALLSGIAFAAPTPLRFATSGGDAVVAREYTNIPREMAALHMELVGRDLHISRRALAALVARGSEVDSLHARSGNDPAGANNHAFNAAVEAAGRVRDATLKAQASAQNEGDMEKASRLLDVHTALLVKAIKHGNKAKTFQTAGNQPNQNQVQKAQDSARESHEIGRKAGKSS